MRDVPIIFSAPMVLALLAGRKTMTRRLRWTGRTAADGIGFRESIWAFVKPGDRLWVRESICSHSHIGFPLGLMNQIGPVGQRIWSYAADGLPDVTGRKPSIHMPRWASRLTLVVETTKIEPVQDITEQDAIAEGVEYRHGCWGIWNSDGTLRCGGSDDPCEAFRCLWINLHGPDTWEANPEVVAISFRVEQKNIDELRKAA